MHFDNYLAELQEFDEGSRALRCQDEIGFCKMQTISVRFALPRLKFCLITQVRIMFANLSCSDLERMWVAARPLQLEVPTCSVYNNKPNISYCCNISIKYEESHIAGDIIKAFVILGNNNIVRLYRDKFMVFLVVFA